VHRSETDKTRLGTGLISQTQNASTLGTPTWANPGFGGEYDAYTLLPRNEMRDTASPDLDISHNILTFDSPDFQIGTTGFENSIEAHQKGDTIRIIGLLEGGWTKELFTEGGGGTGTASGVMEYTKYYDCNRPQRYPDILGESAPQLIYEIDYTTPAGDRLNRGDANTQRKPFYTGELETNIDPLSTAHKSKTFVNITGEDIGTTIPAGRLVYSSGYGLRTQVIKLKEDIEYQKFWGTPYTPGTPVWNSTGRRVWKLLGSYERILKDQYGGNTFSTRSNNEYISCGNFVPVNNFGVTPYTGQSPLTFDLFGGDTYVSFYGTTKIRPFSYSTAPGPADYIDEETFFSTEEGIQIYYFDSDEVPIQGMGSIFPTESSINMDLRTGCHLCNRWDSDFYPPYMWPEYASGAFAETWLVDEVYNLPNNILNYFARPSFVDLNNDHDIRIYASEVKVNGETIDSWRDFTTYTYIELEGVHGPINKLSMLADTVYAIQDKAFAKISINPTAVVQSETDIALQLGRGGVLDDYKYVSTKYGSKHQWSVLNTDSGIYFFDVNHRKLLGFDGAKLQSLSDTAGMSAYFANQWKYDLLTYDNPIEKRGIATTYDSRFGEVIFTFRDREAQEGEIPYIEHDVTIAYSEPVKAFTGFYSFHPPIYINDGKRVLTPKDTDRNKVYVHNQGDYGNFYGTVYPSTVNIVCNESPVNTKAFDNMSWHTEVIDETGTNPINLLKETINTVRFYNDYQNSDYITLTTTNLKREEREWQMQVARDSVIQTVLDPDIFSPANLLPAQKFKKRIRSKYMLTDLTFDNTLNRRLILHYIKTFFRISIR